MALPAVLLKAKDAIKTGAKMKQVGKQLKGNTTEPENETAKLAKKGLGLVALILMPILLFVIFVVVIVSLPQTLFTMFGAIGGGNNNSTSVNVQPGEAASIEGEEARIDWLYDGKGVPETEEENIKYLEDFEVVYLDKNGDQKTMNMTMHKKLKTEVQAIFQDMVNAGFKLEWESGGGSIRGWNADLGYGGNFYRSAHCYGHAIDINVDANCYKSPASAACSVGSHYSPGDDPYSVTPEIVDIWKKHGFYWGGDWTSLKDYMHFSYFNH